MINVAVWLFCAGPMARCIAVWLDFFSQPEVKVHSKVGHVVSDMTERKSMLLRRVL